MGKVNLIVLIIAFAWVSSSQEIPQTKPAIVQPIPTKQEPKVSTTGQDTHFQNSDNQPKASIFPILNPSSDSQLTRDIPAQQQINQQNSSAHDLAFTTLEGQDRQHSDPRFCTKIQQPICGSNGKTYSNTCLFNQEKLTNPGLSVARNGEC